MNKKTILAGIVLASFCLSLGANAFYELTPTQKTKLDSVVQKIQEVLANKPTLTQEKIYNKLEQKRLSLSSEKLQAYIAYVQESLTGTTQTPVQTGTTLPPEEPLTGSGDQTGATVSMKTLGDFPDIKISFQAEKLEVYEGDEGKLKIFLDKPAPTDISVAYTFKGRVTSDEIYNYSGEIVFASGSQSSQISFIPLVDCIEDAETAYIEIIGASTFSQKIEIKDTNEKTEELNVQASPDHTGSIIISGSDQKHLFFPTSMGEKYTIYYDKLDCTAGDTVGGMATGASNALQCTPVSQKPVSDNAITVRYETHFGGVCVWRKK